MTEFTWQDPPAPSPGGGGRRSSVFTDEVQDALKAHPGKWMLLIKEATAANVSNALSWTKKRPGFKVTSRTVAERRGTTSPYAVYACFDPSELTEDVSA